jgi:hypothetical protein
MEEVEQEIQDLWSASSDELTSLLGLNALPLFKSPGEMLHLARSGALAGGATVMGYEYKSDELKQIGHSFLERWKGEIRAAICGNRELLAKERETALNQMHLLVSSIVVALTTHIPALAPFSPLLLVLSVMIVKSGLAAWCAEPRPDPGAHRAEKRPGTGPKIRQ